MTKSTSSAPTPSASSPAPAPSAPIARRDHHERTMFGHRLVDDYAWLQKKGEPEVEAYLRAENDYAAAKTKHLEGLREALYAEMASRIIEDDVSVPVRDGAFEYYRRFEKGKQYPIQCRKKAGSATSPEEVMLDLNALAEGKSFVDVEEMVVSDDGGLLAYTVDDVGYRQYTLRLKDLRTGAMLAEAIPRVDAVVFAKDGKTLWYATQDAVTKRTNKVFRHRVGDTAEHDVLVYEEKDEMFDLALFRSRSKAMAIVASLSKTTSEARWLDAEHPTHPPVLIEKRQHDHRYFVDHFGGKFFIRTNSGGPNFRIVVADAANPARSGWREIVPHRNEVALERMVLFEGALVTLERKDALPQLTVRALDGTHARTLEQPEPIYDVAPERNPEAKAGALRFSYQSPKTPPTIAEFDLKTCVRRVLKASKVPGGYDPDAYETRRSIVRARDGAEIPISLAFKKGTAPDGTHPVLLYGYGAYGFTVPLSFSAERISWLDRGFVFVQAHIRGGGDLGKQWHDRGRMSAKMNTFTDFIDVAEHLGKYGWCKPGGMVVSGRSAGGLLMGAVANLRPDLFSVVMAGVPFVDVINTMLDESLPLTVGEFEEWGNPKLEADFASMIRYSPYDNVAAKDYPAMLVRTSYNDSQVMYWEPAKWVARLRATKTDHRDLLFLTALSPAGHGGQSGRYDRLRDAAWDLAFVLDQLGMSAPRR